MIDLGSGWAMAAQEKKKLVLAPNLSTHQELSNWARGQLIALASGCLGDLECISPRQEQTLSWRESLMLWFRAIVLAIVPIFIVCMVQHWAPTVQVPVSIHLLTCAWGLYILVSQVDPKIVEKMSNFKQLLETLNSLDIKPH